MLTVFTIVTRSYLSYARSLMADVARHIPSARRVVFLADDPQGRFNPAKEKFEVVLPEAYAPARYRHFAFALTPTGLCCLLKPYAATYARRQSPGGTTLYLDADISLLAPPTDLLATLEQHPIVLTPHILEVDRNQLAALHLAVAGPYNAGLIAFGAQPAADRFLGWWAAQFTSPQRAGPPPFWDQTWLNLVPALFPEAHGLRHPGYNVACWNLHERELTSSHEVAAWKVNGEPLVVLHFSGFQRGKPWGILGEFANLHATDPRWRGLGAAYEQRLLDHGAADCEQWGCEFAAFHDGKVITPRHRAYFASRLWDLVPPEVDPFDPQLRLGGHSLKSLYNADHPATRIIRGIREFARQP